MPNHEPVRAREPHASEARRQRPRLPVIALLTIALSFAVVGCMATVPEPSPAPEADEPTAAEPTYVIEVERSAAVVLAGHVVELTARVTPSYDGVILWSASTGEVTATPTNTAVFRPPPAQGTYAVTASLAEVPDVRTSVTVEVPGGLLEPFSITVVPDTQGMVNSSGRAWMVPDMFEWIVANRQDRPIEFVTHVGDVVWNPDNDGQWQRALAGIDLLDGVVPYAIALGDHEYFPEEDKGGSTAAYRSYFGPERYAAYDWYVGAHADGLSHAQTFDAGGRTFLHVSLEWEPTGSVDDPTTPLGWAASVLAANPRVPTIVTTHAYVWDEPGSEGRFPRAAREGTVTVDGVASYVGASGEDLFRELVAPHPQVFMVLSGHYHRASLPDRGKYHQVSLNEAGLEVYEMLSNFQSWPDGGQGWLRLIDFVPGGGVGGLDRIAVSTYSPVLDAAGEYPHQDDARARFAFDLDFGQRFAGY
jgi:hypothetical protein